MGPDKRELVVHADEVAPLSTSLNSLLKNEAFAEANSRRIVWDDVEVDTFLRFIQFAYTGDYEEPSSAVTDGETGASARADYEDDLGIVEDTVWSQFVLRPQRRGRQWRCTSCKTLFYDSEMDNGCPRCPCVFYSRHYSYSTHEVKEPEDASVASSDKLSFPKDHGLSERRSEAIRSAVFNDKAFGELPDEDIIKLSKNVDNVEESDVWQIIFDHAKLYVLAEKWDIEKLRTLCVRKLQLCLGDIKIDAEAMPELFDFVRFVFDNTATSKDLLRGLVTHLVAAEIMTEQMGSRKGFLNLLAEVPDFAVALWGIMYQMRIV